ncbi:MAG TPA: KH domain-containing protein [Candidatus Saccharimonadales bacterium]|nr:KH domain-containing protein [Candidatus Saccharimonadales bacterium]
MAASIDQQFIEYIVKSIVGKPDAVSIKRTIDEKGVLLELTVDEEDLGRVIGKRGATAQSLRTLLRALGTKNDARYNLKIVDAGGPRPSSAGSDDDQKPVEQSGDSDNDEAPTDDEPAVKPTDDESTAADDQTVSDEIEEPRQDENTASENDEADEADQDNRSDLASRTRAELAELDDLDL